MLKVLLLSLVLSPTLISCSSDMPERPQGIKKDVYTGDKGSDVEEKDDEQDTDGGNGDATPKPPRNDTPDDTVDSNDPNVPSEPIPDADPADPRAADLALLKAWEKGKILGSSALKVEKLNLVELK